MRRVEQFLKRSGCDHFAIGQSRDAITNRKQAIEIVGHHKYCQAQGLLQRSDQIVEIRRADRIEAGSGFVEENQLGVKRERSGQRRTLNHAA